MQGLGVVTNAQLLAAGQEPLMKVKIYVGGWLDLNSLVGENYVAGANVSLGGATMTPNPVEGTWGASLFNQDGIFHPQHPTSTYKTYLTTERLTQISIGAIYGGVAKYWPRIIGYMDIPKFNSPDYMVSISGGDFMKRLRETEFRHLYNYWGLIWTINSISSDGATGVEKYINADPMRLVGEDNTDPPNNWVASECTFRTVADIGGTSAWVGKMVTTEVEPLLPTVVLDPVFVPVAGTQYVFNFKYNNEGAAGSSLRVIIKQQPAGRPWIDLAQIEDLYANNWPDIMLYFTAQTNDAIEIWLEIYESALGSEYRFDKFSIFEFVPYWDRHYELRTYDGNEKGVHHVTLDPTTGAEDVWQGQVDEGWYYTEDAEAGPEPPAHPAGIVFFDPNKAVAVGAGNLKIYYYTAEEPEDAIAKMLYDAKVNDPTTDDVPYVSANAAKTRMEAAPGYAATGITIDKIWFEPGTTYLNAIKMFCERGDAAGTPYEFYFNYAGYPVFKPKTMPTFTSFAFTYPKQITSISTYQDRNEIKNRIVIKGIKQAEPVGQEQSMPSELKDEDNDGASIALYGERTLTIVNHLFQDLASITAMCATLLAEYKDPKWYSDLKMDFLPVPLEIGDGIQWEERLSPTLDIMQKGIIRDIKINNFNTTYKCEIVPPIFLDYFEDATRNPEWNDEPNNGTITEAGGVLTFAIANGVNGDFWGALENGPVGYIDLTDENVVILTKLNSYTVNDEARAGLYITDAISPNNGIHFGRARRDVGGTNGLTVVDMNVVELAYVAVTTLPIWLRIRAYGTGAGSTMYFDYSTDGKDWTNLHTQNNEAWNKAGLLVWNWGLFPAVSAPFEFFRIDKF